MKFEVIGPLRPRQIPEFPPGPGAKIRPSIRWVRASQSPSLPPFSFPLCFRMSVSFPTNFWTGWRMHFSWLPTEGRVPSIPCSSVFDTREQSVPLDFQPRCRQTAESHGPALLRYLCDGEENGGWAFISSFMLTVCLGSVVAQLCGSAQVKPCVTSSSLDSTPCR